MVDKSKIDFGEPRLAVSSGVRGKKTVAPTNTILGALDHDTFQKAVCHHLFALKLIFQKL